jgi:general stress protein YciG
MNSFQTMKRKEYGRRGGRATVAKHGREHMQRIGKRGAASFWKRYTLRPAGTSDFAITNRKTGKVIAFMSGRQFKGGEP